MKYLSVCAGIEAATVAWHPLGWEPVGFSEIDRFPSAVLAHHYPDVPNYGDMTDHEQWPTTDIDVLVGGTPCQSFSVAGLRAGMADPRGNLALVYLAIADQYRPRWLVWENVPGVLSSDEGRDFGAIIGGMVELGYSPCWRVLDAQYFGVAQRRRRVFIVASSRDWRDSAEVLLEPSCLRRHPAPRRETGQDVASTLRNRAPGSGGQGTDGEQCVANAIPAHPGLCAPDMTNYVPEVSKSVKTPSGGIDREDMHTILPEVVGALSDGAHCGGGLNGQDAYSGRIIPAMAFKPGQSADAGGLGIGEEVSPTLQGQSGGNSMCPAVAAPLSAGSNPNSNAAGRRQEDDQNIVAHCQDVADPLVAKEQGMYTHEGENNFRTRNVVAFDETQVTHPENRSKPKNLSPTLQVDAKPPSLAAAMAVRRLTPTECERLQGFPDGYTDIPGASDSGRYKALGNSMAVPVMRWIGERIQAVNDKI